MYLNMYIYIYIDNTMYIRMNLYYTLSQRVQSTYIIECRVSILGIAINDLGKYPP